MGGRGGEGSRDGGGGRDGGCKQNAASPVDAKKLWNLIIITYSLLSLLLLYKIY